MGGSLWKAADHAKDPLAIERARDDTQAEVMKRSQADLIGTWISRDFKVFVRNMSYLPIFNIEVYLILGDRAVKLGQTLDVLGPLPHLANVSDHITPELDTATKVEIEGLRANHHTAGAAIVFRDAAGRDWVRRPDGDLRPGPDLIPTPEL